MVDDTDLLNEFTDVYRRLITMKPIPCRLVMGRDQQFYWIYYAGLGECAFHPIQENFRSLLDSLKDTGKLVSKGETVTLPVSFENEIRYASFVVYELVVNGERP